MHIGVIRPRIRVRNEISRFLSSGSTARSVLSLLDPSPDSSSCPGYFRSKRHIREVYELDPPPFGTSAENPGTLDQILTHILTSPHREKATGPEEGELTPLDIALQYLSVPAP